MPRLLALTLLAVLIAGALTSAATAATPRPLPGNPADAFTSRPLDALHYDWAHRCTGGAQPGTLALGRWLSANEPGADWGIYDCRRIHGTSTLSLHAEGRAIDWHLDARTRTGRRAGPALLRLLLAPDARGRRFALVRRMGVQEIIWNCRLWSALHPFMQRYNVCQGTRHPNVTLGHIDHFHIGLNWKGARERTSFWRAQSAHRPSPATRG